MEILRFTLSGKQAFFKKPEVNTYYYFTYGHIHRVALLGMFGAILGYGGYRQQTAQKEMPEFPEFYEKLKMLHISIIPVCEKGSFSSKIVSFNNSVGYASREQGGNLIVKQQWLENPKWYIYVALDCEEAHKLADSILQKKCVFMPYLGSNDHPADITDAAIISATVCDSSNHIDSFFEKGTAKIDWDEEEESPYKYEEMLPYALDSEMNAYEFKKYILTNQIVTQTSQEILSIMDINGENYHIVL